MRIIRGLTTSQVKNKIRWAGYTILQVACRKVKFPLAFFAVLAKGYVAKTSEMKTILNMD